MNCNFLGEKYNSKGNPQDNSPTNASAAPATDDSVSNPTKEYSQKKKNKKIAIKEETHQSIAVGQVDMKEEAAKLGLYS